LQGVPRQGAVRRICSSLPAIYTFFRNRLRRSSENQVFVGHCEIDTLLGSCRLPWMSDKPFRMWVHVTESWSGGFSDRLSDSTGEKCTLSRPVCWTAKIPTCWSRIARYYWWAPRTCVHGPRRQAVGCRIRRITQASPVCGCRAQDAPIELGVQRSQGDVRLPASSGRATSADPGTRQEPSAGFDNAGTCAGGVRCQGAYNLLTDVAERLQCVQCFRTGRREPANGVMRIETVMLLTTGKGRL